jgi:peptidoglycan/LPS O-acetylase OafA/YrhL
MVNSKPHYEILDGLRGVAAIIVVAFSIKMAEGDLNRLAQFPGIRFVD